MLSHAFFILLFHAFVILFCRYYYFVIFTLFIYCDLECT